MFTIKNPTLSIALHDPLDGFYQGTRFDRSGVFDSILFQGTEMAGRWFDSYDPLMHDAVCGPSEEFTPVFLDRGLVKIGVGLLDVPSAQEYDHFKLYGIADPGEWECFQDSSSVTFRHRLPGVYLYEKVVALTGEGSFEIRHRLCSELDLKGEVYNHNFFTFDKMSVGPSREIDFPFRPIGSWRSEYDSVGFTESGVRFTRTLQKGESVYTGDIHKTADGMPYDIALSEAGRFRVNIRSSAPCTHTVMWSNYRIACPEPYNVFESAPGKDFLWTISYRITPLS